MRTQAAVVLLAAGLAVVGCSSPDGTANDTGNDTGNDTTDPAPASDAPSVPGMIIYSSNFDVDTTVANLESGLSSAGMVAATVDHAVGAASVDLELRPTTLVIGGAPPAGTPVMQAAQTAAVDLPQKYLAWEAEDGMVYVGYNSADWVGAQAGLAADDPALDTLRMGSANISETASGSEEPVYDGSGDASKIDGYLIEQISNASVADSIARYETAFDDAGLMRVATVDHAAGAASADLQLRPTSVTIVGNPMIGTPLMQSAQTMGIDLPIRYLAWQDADGVVRVGHPDIALLAARHGVTGQDEILGKVDAATAMFDGVAAGGE